MPHYSAAQYEKFFDNFDGFVYKPRTFCSQRLSELYFIILGNIQHEEAMIESIRNNSKLGELVIRLMYEDINFLNGLMTNSKVGYPDFMDAIKRWRDQLTKDSLTKENKMSNEEIVINNVLLPFYRKIKSEEFVIDKTGVKTVEILGLRMELNPQQKLLNFYDIRKSPEEYIKQEIAWYDSMDLSVKDISKYAKLWANVCTKNDKQLVNSNYGFLVYSDQNYSQYSNVLNELMMNSFSRRAIMIYNRPSMQYDYNKDGMSDFICTLGQQFFIRNGKLISLVEMRSSDMMYGFFSDMPWFATIQDRLLADLKERAYPGLEQGDLIWISNSGHLYEKHFDTVIKIVEKYNSENKI